MERLVDASIADIGRTVYRYRPVVAAGAAIVALGLILPGPSRLGQDMSQFAATGPAASRTSVNPAVPQGDQDEGVVESPAAEDSSSMFTPFTPFTPSPPPASSFNDSSTFDSGPSSPSDDAGSSPSPSAAGSSTTTGNAPAGSSPTTAAPRRAEITAALWASQSAGTPVAANGVPKGSLPVGKVGREDKVTFLRLSGSPDRIVLKEHAEGQRSPGSAVIQACVVKTTGWKSGEAVAFADAPERDCSVSVLGVRAQDGTWSFDLRPFEARSGDGFSFAPAPGSPLDFQVAFVATLS